MTLQRSYRVNLRRDIKDRRIAGALLTLPLGTGSFSVRRLDTCCFLARQLHVARKPWSISSSSSSNIWSCPSVHHLSTLSNTWVMITDLCGYGDKWRTRAGLLMVTLQKHCFTTKGGNCSFSHSKHFFAFAPPTHSALFVDAFGFRALHQCQRNSPLPF